jgi:hypothetical protein
MDFGKTVHAAILEPDVFNSWCAIWGGASKRGKAWEEFKAEYADHFIVTSEEREAIAMILQSVQAHDKARWLIESTKHEVSMFWSHTAYGPAKARIDGYSPTHMFDIKTCRDIETYAFGRQAAALAYPLQMGWYWHGVECSQAQTVESVYIIAIETSPPYDVAVWAVPRGVLEMGRDEAVEIATRYRACQVTNTYPGVDGGEARDLWLPSYARPEEVDISDGAMEASEL